jgi:hypothetical protein
MYVLQWCGGRVDDSISWIWIEVGVAVVVAWGWAEREAKLRMMELKEIEEVGWRMVGMGLVGASYTMWWIIGVIKR